MQTITKLTIEGMPMRKPNLLTLIDCYFAHVPVAELDNIHQLMMDKINATASCVVVLDMLQLGAELLSDYQNNTNQHMVVAAAWKKLKQNGSWRQKAQFNHFINSHNAGA